MLEDLKELKKLSSRNRGVARGEQVGARALGRNSTLFAVILKAFLSRNLDQSMLKNAYFLEITVKIVSASCRRGLGAPPPGPCVVTPAYYYNSVEFVFSAKCILFRSKRTSNYSKCSAYASFALLYLFLIQTL